MNAYSAPGILIVNNGTHSVPVVTNKGKLVLKPVRKIKKFILKP